MTEKFLQFVWKNQLFDRNNLYSIDNQKITIIHPGFLNNDEGADFFNAKIKIDDKIWIGNVEIHLKNSDWYKHKHHKNPYYNNVILHVVAEADKKEIFNANGVKIPTLVIKFNQKYYENYQKLILNKSAIPCGDFLKKIPDIYKSHWLENTVIERLMRKAKMVLNELKRLNNDWNETFYIFLAKNFGLKKNALPFEMLAKSLSFKYLQKHKDNLLQIEAMLFGQAGLLKKDCDDDYSKTLKQEYKFLKEKFSLKPIDKKLWIFLRTRPANFPTIRIAQLAKLLFNKEHIFSLVIENEIVNYYEFFRVRPSKYWNWHYDFCKKLKREHEFGLSDSTIDNILINTVAVFLFAYGYIKNLEEYKTKAIDLLTSLRPENNSIIRKWLEADILPKNAADSQALIETYNEYCKKGKCLDCKIGQKIIIKL